MGRANTASIGGELTIGTRKARKALADAKTDMERTARDMGNIRAPQMGSGFIGKWTELKSKIDLVAGAAGKAGGALKKVFDSEASFEGLVRALASTNDGSETLRAELEALKETAKLPGLGFREAIQGATALKGAGLEAKKAREILEAFGNALANSGKGKAELDGVITSIEQMLSVGAVDQGNLKEIGRRVTGFFDMIAGVDRSDPYKFLDGVLERLQRLPKAAESSQDAVDNLQDSIDQAKLSETGGKTAAYVGGVASNISGDISKGNYGDALGSLSRGVTGAVMGGAGWLMDKAGLKDYDADAVEAVSGVKTQKGDVIDKYSPDAKEVERRRTAKKAAKEDQENERRETATRVLKEQGELLEAELELDKARASEDEKAIAAAEDKLAILKESKSLMESLKISEQEAVQAIKEQNQMRRDAAAWIKKTEQEKAGAAKSGERADAKSALQIDMLRSRGRGRAADRLQKAKDIAGEKKRLTDMGYSDSEAQSMAEQAQRAKADSAHFEKTGRHKVRGMISKNVENVLTPPAPGQKHLYSSIPGFDAARRPVMTEARERIAKKRDEIHTMESKKVTDQQSLSELRAMRDELSRLNDTLLSRSVTAPGRR